MRQEMSSEVKHITALWFHHWPCADNETWGDYITNVIYYDYLSHTTRLRLRINKITM